MQVQYSKKLVDIHSLTCEQKKEAKLACFSQNCNEHALICGDSSCSCSKKHTSCQTNQLQAFLAKLENCRREVTHEASQSAKAIQDIYEKMMRKLLNERMWFADTMAYFGLNDWSIALVNSMNEGKKISGAMFSSVQKFQIQSNKQIVGLASLKSIQKIWQQTQNTLSNIWSELRGTQKIFNMNELKLIERSQDAQNPWGQVIKDTVADKTYTFRQWYDRGRYTDQIDELDLGSKNLSSIPVQISCLNNLRRLYLYDNKLTKIENLDQLKQLTYLDLKTNQLTKIQGLENCTQLTCLSLADNKITTLENIDHLQLLGEIYLQKNPIEKSEPQLAMIGRLKERGTYVFWDGQPQTTAN